MMGAYDEVLLAFLYLALPEYFEWVVTYCDMGIAMCYLYYSPVYERVEYIGVSFYINFFD